MIVCYGFNEYWLFFFFKQKTAYEMRISDWSSDVCSSDLLFCSDEKMRALERLARLQPDKLKLWIEGDNKRRLFEAFSTDDILTLAYSRWQGTYQQQSGRASCRERVCQYV